MNVTLVLKSTLEGVEMRRALGHDIKSLQYFINRTKVLQQFREFLRISKPLPIDVRLNVRHKVRAGFEACRHEKDERRLGVLLRQGREQLKIVSELVDTAQAKHNTESDSEKENSHSTKMDLPPDTSDGKDDVKGRLGTGWPWVNRKGASRFDLKAIKRR